MNRWTAYRAGHAGVTLWGIRVDGHHVNLWLPGRWHVTYRRGEVSE